MELDRLHQDQVAVMRPSTRIGAPGTRATLRSYCDQVWKLAGLWNGLEKSVRVSEFTFRAIPCGWTIRIEGMGRAVTYTGSAFPARLTTASLTRTRRRGLPLVRHTARSSPR